jgi:hypothetical protein
MLLYFDLPIIYYTHTILLLLKDAVEGEEEEEEEEDEEETGAGVPMSGQQPSVLSSLTSNYSARTSPTSVSDTIFLFRFLLHFTNNYLQINASSMHRPLPTPHQQQGPPPPTKERTGKETRAPRYSLFFLIFFLTLTNIYSFIYTTDTPRTRRPPPTTTYDDVEGPNYGLASSAGLDSTQNYTESPPTPLFIINVHQLLLWHC